MQKNEYNQIFEKLVKSDNPVGLIAYSLYKKQKRKIIIEHTKNGNVLTDKDIKGIEKVLENQLNLFKDQANNLLDKTYETLIEKNKNKIYATYFKNDEFVNINAQLKKLPAKRAFVIRLGESLLFKFIWVVIITIISIVIYVHNDKFMEIGNKFTQIFQQETAP